VARVVGTPVVPVAAPDSADAGVSQFAPLRVPLPLLSVPTQDESVNTTREIHPFHNGYCRRRLGRTDIQELAVSPLLLAFPPGLAYYVVLVVGFSPGIALSVPVVGLGILLVAVVGPRLVASFERSLANILLGTTVPEPRNLAESGGGIVASVKAYVGASAT